MDKSHNLKVTFQDLVILRNAVEKIQIFGKDAIVVADIYSRILELTKKAEQERLSE
jgi:hypothetical protein